MMTDWLKPARWALWLNARLTKSDKARMLASNRYTNPHRACLDFEIAYRPETMQYELWYRNKKIFIYGRERIEAIDREIDE